MLPSWVVVYEGGQAPIFQEATHFSCYTTCAIFTGTCVLDFGKNYQYAEGFF